MLPTMVIVLGTVAVAIVVVILVARLVNDSPFQHLEESFEKLASQFDGSFSDEGWYSGLACEIRKDDVEVLVHPVPSGGGFLKSHYKVEVRASAPGVEHAVSTVLSIEEAADAQKLAENVVECVDHAKRLRASTQEKGV